MINFYWFQHLFTWVLNNFSNVATIVANEHLITTNVFQACSITFDPTISSAFHFETIEVQDMRVVTQLKTHSSFGVGTIVFKELLLKHT